jgi:hypothetical protein
MTIGVSRFTLRGSAISFGMRMTREFPDVAARALFSSPKNPRFLTSLSISSIVSWERYSEPHLTQTSHPADPEVDSEEFELHHALLQPPVVFAVDVER